MAVECTSLHLTGERSRFGLQQVLEELVKFLLKMYGLGWRKQTYLNKPLVDAVSLKVGLGWVRDFHHLMIHLFFCDVWLADIHRKSVS